MRWCVAVAAVGAAAACRRDDAVKPITPSDAVSQYFAAVKARDCAALTALSGGITAHRLKQNGCEGMLVAYEATKLELVNIERAEPDGRDSSQVLVHVVVKKLGSTGTYGTQAMMVRVSTAGGRMRVVEL